MEERKQWYVRTKWIAYQGVLSVARAKPRRWMAVVLFQVAATVAQDYEVSDIQCSGAGSAADLLTAKIKRPVGFRGVPLFADDRSANPLTDIHCQIRPDPNDPQEDNYFLKVTDFSKCGILKRNVSHRSRFRFSLAMGTRVIAIRAVLSNEDWSVYNCSHHACTISSFHFDRVGICKCIADLITYHAERGRVELTL